MDNNLQDMIAKAVVDIIKQKEDNKDEKNQTETKNDEPQGENA